MGNGKSEGLGVVQLRKLQRITPSGGEYSTLRGELLQVGVRTERLEVPGKDEKRRMEGAWGPELAYFRKCGDHVEGSVPVAVNGEGTRGL